MTQQTLSIRFAADNRSLVGSTRESSSELRKFAADADIAGQSLRNNFSGATRQGINSISTQLAAARNQLAGFVGARIGLGLVKDLAATADSATNLSSKLRNVTASEEDLGRVREKTFAIAQRTRANYEATVELYARMTRATTALGLSEEQRLQITETINKAMVVSGASAQEASAAIAQLSQGLASGALRGDEFNSVAEQAPVLMDLLAKSLNMTRGELRAYAAEGKITAEVVTTALLQGGAQIDAQFANMGTTISGAGTQLSNAMTRWVGEADRGAGATQLLASGITFLADNFDGLASGVLAIAGIVAAKYVGALVLSAVQMAKNTQETNRLAAAELREAQAAEAQALAKRNGALAMARAGLETTRLAAAEGTLAAAQARTAAATAATTTAMGSMRTAGAGLFALVGGWPAVLIAAAAGLAYLVSSSNETSETFKSLSQRAEGNRNAIALMDEANRRAERGLAALSDGLDLQASRELAAAESARDHAAAMLFAATQTSASDGTVLRWAASLEQAEGKLRALQQQMEEDARLSFVREAMEDLAGFSRAIDNASAKAAGLVVIDPAAQAKVTAGLTEQVGKLKAQRIELTEGKKAALEYAAAQELNVTSAKDLPPAIAAAIDAVVAEKKAIDEATEATKRTRESRTQLAASSRELARDEKVLRDVIEDQTTAIERGLRTAEQLAAGVGGPLAQATRAYDDDVKILSAALVALDAQMALGAISAEEYALAKDRLAEAAANAGDAVDRESASIAAQGDVLGRYQKQILEDTSMVGLSDRQRFIAEAVRDQTAAWNDNVTANRENKQTLEELQAGVATAAAGLYDYTAAAEANEEASRQWAQTWERGVADVSDALGDLIASGLSDWSSFGDAMEDIARRFLANIASQFLQAQFGQLLGLGGGSGPSFGSIFSAFGGGGGSTAGGGLNVGSIGQMFGGGTGGLGTLGNLGSMFGFGSAGAGSLAAFGGVASPAFAAGGFTGGGGLAFNGMGFGGASFGGGTGAYGVGAAGTTAGTTGGAGGAGAAGMGAMGVAAIIAVAMMVNDSLYGKGWRVQGGNNSMAGDFATLGAVTASDRLLRGLGLDGRTASLLSGSSVHTALWGLKAPEVTGQGANFSFGADGASGSTWADIKRKGGLFRSDKKWTERGALDEDVQAELTAFWESLVRDNAAIAAAVLGEAPDVVTASFRQERDKKGNITKEVGTIMGHDYLATWAEFQNVIRAENAISAASTGSAMLEVATPEQTIRTWDPETRRWTVEVQEAGTVLVNELQQVAERYRGNADLLVEGASLLVGVQTDLARGTELLGESGAGALTNIVDFVEEMQHTGESLPDAYTRISIGAAMLDQALGLSGVNLAATREEVVRFATGIVDAAGGLDQASALYNDFYSRFYSPEERTGYALEQATASASTQFTAAGLDLSDFTGEGGLSAFRSLFEEQLPEMSAEQTVQYLRLAQALGIVTDLTAQYNATLGETALPVAQTAEQLQAIQDILAGNEWDATSAQMTTADRAIAEVNKRFDEQQKQLLLNAATAKQLTVLEEQRTAALLAQQAALAAQRGSILDGNDRDLASARMTTAERGEADINRGYDEQRASLINLGATVEELTRLDEQRTAALAQQAQVLANQRAEILAGNDRDLASAGMTSAERAMAAVGERFDEQRTKLVDLGATTAELTRLDEQRTAALAQQASVLAAQRSDLLAGNDRELARAGMSDYERQLDEINQRYDEQRATLIDLGATSEELRRLEEQRGASLQNAAQIESARLEAAAGEYRDFIENLWRETSNLSAFQREQFRIEDWQDEQIAAANAHAIAAGEAGASEQALALIERRAAAMRAAAVAQLRSETQSLYDQLYGTAAGAGDGMTAGMDAAADAAAEFWQRQREQVESLNDYLDGMLLGDLSALTPEEQLSTAWQQLQDAVAAGDVGRATQLSDVYLRLLRESTASGDDYNNGANGVAGFWDVRSLLEGLRNSIAATAPPEAGGTGGSQSGQTAEQAAALVAADRLQLALQFSEHLRDLSGAINQPVFALVEEMGVSLRQLAGDLGVNLTQITGESVQGLATMASLLGVNLTELTGEMGLQLSDLGGGLRELATGLGIDLSALTTTSTTALADLANTLGLDLTDVAAAVGISLGSLADDQSLLNDALEATINGLPTGTRDELRPLLEAVENATNEADANAAIDALNAAVNLLAPDIRNQLAPYLADVFPADALDDLDYLQELAGTGRDQVTAIRAVESKLGDVTSATDRVHDRISAASDEYTGISRSMLDELERIANNTESQNSAAGVPSYAVGTGTANVQGDQLANIHDGEKVIDAQTSAFLDRYGIRVTSTGGGGGDSADVVAALQLGFRALQEQLANVARTVQRGAEHVADTVDGSSERTDSTISRAMDDMAYAVGGSGRGRG